MDINFDDIEIKSQFNEIDNDDRKEELIAKRITLYELLTDGKMEKVEEQLADILENIA